MIYRLASDKKLTDEILANFITQHQADVKNNLQRLDDAYKTKYDILKQKEKPDWKPDNRIAVNFAKYIVDTMNGFFIGVPIKTTVTDDENGSISQYVELLDKYNDQDNNNAELAKLSSIFGMAYEMYFVDKSGQIGITYLSPMESFMIYDDSILEEPRFFVRLYVDSDNLLHGSVSDEKIVKFFTYPGNIKWDKKAKKPHGFDGVPAVEYNENDERMGIFEPVLTMINAYNKALSEKANDVDYFADAYLKILGSKLDEPGLQGIRDNRIINLEGDDAEKIIVDFLQKPDGDTTQENLINRLEKLIYQISMVANISDESFGTASGIALKYKLLAMSNLAKTKERKFASGMNRRYKLIFSNPVSPPRSEDWLKLTYRFTRNMPANLLEESQIAQNLAGVTSKETQLGVISAVEDVNGEIEKIEAENKLGGTLNDMFSKGSDE